VNSSQPREPGLARKPDFIVLLAALFLVLGLVVFFVLAALISTSPEQTLDEQIIQALRNPDPEKPKKPIGPFWLQRAGPDITALGSASVLALITILVAGYLLLWRKYGAAVLLVVATVGGVALETMLKHIIQRERPDRAYRVLEATTTSFPSGHSMLSAVVYLTLGALLARFVSRPAEKMYVLAVAMLLTVLVGASRVYLRVHYPTDVLAGWSAGLVWAMICWLTAHYLQRRRIVEPPIE
jgi:undecaprenyl-diphosphatase